MLTLPFFVKIKNKKKPKYTDFVTISLILEDIARITLLKQSARGGGVFFAHMRFFIKAIFRYILLTKGC